MSLTRRATLAGLILVAGPAAAQGDWRAAVPPGAYVLDPLRSSLTARLRFLGLSRYNLRFTKISGRLLHDGRPTPNVSIDVDPRAVDRPSDLAARQSIALLEPDRYPKVSFTGRELRGSGERETLLGDLTMHGVTRPVAFEFRLRSMEVEKGASARLAFTGQGQIQRSAFGMSAMRSLVGDRIDLLFDVEFVQR